MAEASAKDDVSPLSSEFEDLGVSDEASKSTGGGGEADWSEGGEEVVGRRHGSGSSSATSPAAQQAGAAAHQSMPSEATRASAAQTRAQESDTRKSSAGSRQPGEPDDKVYATLKELEDAGHKVADFTKHAASDLSKKLFGGGGGSGSRGAGASEEGFSISKITEGVSSWWSALDASSLVPDVGPPSPATSPAQVKSDAQQLFGLPATEETLETFSCSLVQSYSCRHNAFTGPKEVVWRGMLYITDRHSCWKAQGDSTTLMLPHADVTSAEKMEKGGKGLLRISFGSEGERLVLRDFNGGMKGLDDALALLEHVTSSS